MRAPMHDSGLYQIKWLTKRDRSMLSSQDEVNSMHHCRVWLSKVHTWVFFFFFWWHWTRTLAFLVYSFDFPPVQTKLNSPPSLLSSAFLFLHVQYSIPSSLFIFPCAFLSSSCNLCLYSSPLFPLSYLSICQGFAPPHLLIFSSLLHQTSSEEV